MNASLWIIYMKLNLLSCFYTVPPSKNCIKTFNMVFKSVWAMFFIINFPKKTDQQWDLQKKHPPVLYFLPCAALELLSHIIWRVNTYRTCEHNSQKSSWYLRYSWTHVTVPHYWVMPKFVSAFYLSLDTGFLCAQIGYFCAFQICKNTELHIAVLSILQWRIWSCIMQG